MTVWVTPARGGGDLDLIRALFHDYAAALDVDLASQGFAAELATLPGTYAPPRGVLLLARDDGGGVLGCVGVRPFERPGACEIKRLYVRPNARRKGAGFALAAAAVAFAEAQAYREVLLDTLPQMTAAIGVYRALGFAPIPPYWNNVLPGILYFGRQIGPRRGGVPRLNPADPRPWFRPRRG